MIHPDTELRFISSEIGFGVVATKLIPKGTVTWVQDALDRVFTPEEIEMLDSMYGPILECYTFRNGQGNYILCWDNGRYVNHSFHPSCITTAYDFELAVRDINPGEELTDDYGYFNLEKPFYALPERRCSRKTVMPDDLLRYHPRWDRQLRSAFKRFSVVKQPLARFLDPDVLARAHEISAGTCAMDSILNCYYNGERKSGSCP
jgi:hypothetical protein